MTRPVRTVRLRRLARELKRLREGRGLTQADVVDRTDVSRSSLLRAEAADVCPSRHTLRALLDHYGVPDAERAELWGLWERAAEPGWLTPLMGRLPPAYSTYIAFESEACEISWFELYVVPGLLQIPEYVAALVRAGLEDATDAEIETRLEARAERQRAFFGRNARLSVVLAEAAIRCPVGGTEVMDAQLGHLAEMAQAPNVAVRVLPFAAGAFGSMSAAFEILDYEDEDDPSLAYLESAASQQFREEEEELRGFRDLFRGLSAKALDQDDSARLIADAISANGRK